MSRLPPTSTLFPSPTLSQSPLPVALGVDPGAGRRRDDARGPDDGAGPDALAAALHAGRAAMRHARVGQHLRSEEHTSELQSRQYLVCRLLLEKKKKLTSEHQ